MPTLDVRGWGTRRLGAVLVLVALVAAGVAIAWAFRPETGSGSGTIAFVRDRSTIYTVADDGSSLRRLHGSLVRPAYDPHWSPDGKRIVFVSSCRLYVMNSAGGGLRALANTDPYCAEQPDWSPDGEQIAFRAVSDTTTDRAVIAVTGLQGSPPRLLSQRSIRGARYDDVYPDWSSDGQRIVFARFTHEPFGPSSPDPLLYVIRADGTGLTKIPPDPSAVGENMPAWSPDGAKIALGQASGGIMHVSVLQLSNGKYESMTTPPKGGSGGEMGMSMPGDKHPSWSPDGRTIAFASDRGIAAVNEDGGQRRMVTAVGRDDSPVWSPVMSASAGGMGMNWWPWWITSLVGLLVVGAATAVLVTVRSGLRIAAAVTLVVAAGLAIAAPVVMTSSGDGGAGSPSMMGR